MDGARSEIECLLLTWHGTLVCATPDGKGSHRPATERDPGLGRLMVDTQLDPKFADVLPLPDEALPYRSPLLGAGVATRAGAGRGYVFKRDDRFLCAVQDAPALAWDRERPGHWETFLPLPVAFYEKLIALRQRRWVDASTGEILEAGALEFKADFRLAVGGHELDLTQMYPLFRFDATAPGGETRAFVIALGDRVAAFASWRGNTGGPLRRIWLREAAHDFKNAHGPAGHPEEPGSHNAALLKSEGTVYFPPAFAHRDDREFFLEKGWRGRPPLGYTQSHVVLRRATNCYLYLARSLEGVIFDARGVYRDYGFITMCPNLPAGLVKQEDRYFQDVARMNEAPLLQGDYAVFYNGNLQNYYHWTVEGMVPLFLLRQLKPGPTRIVLPAGLQGVANLPYLEGLKLFGLDAFEITFSQAPLVRLEHATWVNPGRLGDEYPAPVLREFQATLSASLGPLPPPARLYVERQNLRGIANATQVRERLETLGFTTIRLEGMSLLDQARHFASAEFVVAPHGAGLSNLVFTPPAARVIEFMPNPEMRPFFWMISRKLGHEYGMLPCPTADGGFNGALTVDLDKFMRLFTLLEKA